MSAPEPPPRRRGAAAIALIVVGLLILIPSGLCTSAFVIMGLVTMFSEPGDSTSSFMEALVFGGPFILVGAALLALGLRGRR